MQQEPFQNGAINYVIINPFIVVFAGFSSEETISVKVFTKSYLTSHMKHEKTLTIKRRKMVSLVGIKLQPIL
jgi:hypothetical protein